MLPQKIWNLGPLKLLKMFPILSIIGKKAHNFSQFFPVCFLFFVQNTYDMYRQLATKDKILIVGSTFSSSMLQYGSAGNAINSESYQLRSFYRKLITV